MRKLVVLVVLAAGLAGALAGAWETPGLSDRYNYQIGQLFDPSQYIPGVRVYTLDGWDTPASTVAWLRAQGAYPVCYFSAGSFENWRPDAGQFLAADKGAAMGDWPGEWWLNIRSDNVKTIMAKRMQMCKDKGFLAVDADNVDGYTNMNGCGLTFADQLAYNTWLANTAHSLGLGIGLKNALDQVSQLVGLFDFFVNEQCNEYSECDMYAPAKAAGKPVHNIEYSQTTYSKGCTGQDTYGMRTVLKTLSLTALPFTECTTAKAASPSPSPKPSPKPSPSPSPTPSVSTFRVAASPSPSPKPSPSPSPSVGTFKVAASPSPSPRPSPSPSPKLSPSPSPKPSPSPSPKPSPSPSPNGIGVWWQPKASDNLHWQYMISGPFDAATMWVATAQVYLLDLWVNTPAAIAAVRAKGGVPVCVFNAGTYEDWQVDAPLIPPAARPGNLWLDVRAPSVRAVMKSRIAACKAAGFIGVVPVGVDAFTNANGMGLTAADQLSYNTFLALEAHAAGLAMGLMNDLEQVAQLLPYVDFFVNEDCIKYSECGAYAPAKAANLPVFNVEYGSTTATTTAFQNACKCQSMYGMKPIYKKEALGTFRVECTATTMTCPYKARRMLQ